MQAQAAGADAPDGGASLPPGQGGAEAPSENESGGTGGEGGISAEGEAPPAPEDAPGPITTEDSPEGTCVAAYCTDDDCGEGAYVEWGDPVTTGADGGYAFYYLTPGKYEVRLGIPKGYTLAPASEGHMDAGKVLLDSLEIEDMGGAVESEVIVRAPKGGGGSGDGDGASGTDANGTGAGTEAWLKGHGPQTGDDTSFALPLALGLLSLGCLGCGVALAASLRRRQKARLAAGRRIYHRGPR